MHGVWSHTTYDRLAPFGLDFLTSYVGGRAASLGEPVGSVVASAFAWFADPTTYLRSVNIGGVLPRSWKIARRLPSAILHSTDGQERPIWI